MKLTVHSFLKIGFSTLLLLLFIACSSDDDNIEGEDLDLGTAKITVSGDIEGEKEGQADFDYVNGANTWHISMHDFSPQTFSFTISRMGGDSLPPAPGEYEFGFTPNREDEDIFTAIYTHIEDEDYTNSTEYANIIWLAEPEFEETGTLTITESSDRKVKGTFECEIYDWDLSEETAEPEINGTIQVSGSFTARERISL